MTAMSWIVSKKIVIPLSLAAAVAVILPAGSSAEDGLRQRLRERLSDHAAKRPEMKGAVELAYGADPLQKLDVWKPKKAGSPMVVFVHGGAWKMGDKRSSVGVKSTHFLERGYGFASVNYRLVPSATVAQQAEDVAAAIALLLKQSDELGIDRSRIVLMGHSAGAHLAALVGTDPAYLKKAGLGADAIRGVIPVDGACYDVPRQMTAPGSTMREVYVEVFGTDRHGQLAVSPMHHAKSPNAPDFLILHVRRIDGTMQSRALGKALSDAGTRAEVHGFEGTGLEGHMEINRRLGDPSYPATPVMDAWLERIFAK